MITIYDVIKSLHQTEKSTSHGTNWVYFKVHKDANKFMIKQAVESIFKVEVDSVKVMNYQGKAKRFGRNLGRRSNWKKAAIKLVDGQTLEA